MRHLLLPVLAAIGVSACDPSESDRAGPAIKLLETAEQGDLSALERLLKPSTDVDVRDSCDWTPLMKAALYGHIDVVGRLLDAGAAIDAEDKGGYTAMMLAASNNHEQVLDRLLRAGAMVDHQEHTRGWTALIWAASKGHTRSVETLLRHGADPTLKDDDGYTAADRAAEGDHRTALQRLQRG